MTKEDAGRILAAQKAWFRQGHTLPYAFRMEQLGRLYDAVRRYEGKIAAALQADLGKCAAESYMSETGMVLAGISHIRKHLKGWMRPKREPSPMTVFPSSGRVEYTPKGSVLIIGPYNYPFQLAMEPLAEALAAGNCAVISPSELTPSVSAVLEELVAETFDGAYVRCVPGGVEANTALLACRFDAIFFTGSPRVGKIVMEAAAKNLVPVTLELGGKSPVIVDETARLDAACRRIAWGKLLNAGQTCVAPDYVLVHRRVFQPFIKGLTEAIRAFYGEDSRQSPDYGRIVNRRHMERLTGMLTRDKAFIRFGGRWDGEARYIEPTILCPDSFAAACMQEEIFGPLLPVFPYDRLEEALDRINGGETPLALYIFSEDKGTVETILGHTASGGVCVNDTVSHLIHPGLPFGGLGESGMGHYHGEAGFRTFSHARSVLRRSTRVVVNLAFPPYGEKKLRAIKRFMK